MGEIAEMMLDGTLCEGCGVYIEGEGEGFPRYCSPQCARDRGADWALESQFGIAPQEGAAPQERGLPSVRQAVQQ